MNIVDNGIMYIMIKLSPGGVGSNASPLRSNSGSWYRQIIERDNYFSQFTESESGAVIYIFPFRNKLFSDTLNNLSHHRLQACLTG